MITGIGTDLAETARVSKAAARPGFLNKVFTVREQELIALRPARAAANFSAKEAVSKALGCGFRGISPIEIEILRTESGAPYVVLHGEAEKKAIEQGITRIHVSITDTAELSQAVAVCEKEESGSQTRRKERVTQFIKVPFLSSQAMKLVDQETIENENLPAVVLMEQAAGAVIKWILPHITKESKVCVLCGNGNNGGDGLAVARLLQIKGTNVTAYLSADPETLLTNKKGSKEFLWQLYQAQSYGVPFACYFHGDADIKPDRSFFDEYDIIVDALFGIGLTGTVRKEYGELIELLNREPHTVISVDIPSGINGDTGKVEGAAVFATETVTFGAAKNGHLLYPGKEFTGILRVEPIGFPEKLFVKYREGFFLRPLSGEETVKKEEQISLPRRAPGGNKGTFGKVTVIAGSKNMAGAAYLSAYAAYRTGAGLVAVVTPECNRVIIQTKLPEALLMTYTEETDFSELAKKAVDTSDAVVIGPGLSTGKEAGRLLEAVREELRSREEKAPFSVFDADALNLLAKILEKQSFGNTNQRIEAMLSLFPKNCVATPHPMELKRLTGISVGELLEKKLLIAKQFAEHSDPIFVLKDAVTAVAGQKQIFLQTAGNSGMATGGSGDVLTGIIASLAAAGQHTLFDAAVLGVYLHGLSGDEAKRQKTEASVMAGDIAAVLGKILTEAEGDRR